MLGAALPLGFLAGCTGDADSPKEPSPTPRAFVDFGGLTFTVTSASLKTQLDLGFDSGSPEFGMVWLVVKQTARNQSNSSVSLNSNSFKALVDGVEYREDDSATETTADKMDLKSMGDWLGTDINPSKSVKFVHVYQVPEDGTDFFLEISQGGTKRIGLNEFLPGMPANSTPTATAEPYTETPTATTTNTPRPTSTPQGPTPSPQPPAVAKIGSMTFTITNALMGTSDDIGIDLGYSDEGMAWFVVFQTSKNASGVDVMLSSWDFVLIVDGIEYTEDSSKSDDVQDLLGVESAGDMFGTRVDPYSSISFVHVFQIPVTAGNIRLQVSLDSSSTSVDLNRFVFAEEVLTARTSTPTPTRTPVPQSGEAQKPALMNTPVVRAPWELTVLSGSLLVDNVADGYSWVQTNNWQYDTAEWHIQVKLRLANRDNDTVEIDVANFSLTPYRCDQSGCQQYEAGVLPISSSLAFVSVEEGQSVVGTMEFVIDLRADLYALTYTDSSPAFWQLPGICEEPGASDCLPIRLG